MKKGIRITGLVLFLLLMTAVFRPFVPSAEAAASVGKASFSYAAKYNATQVKLKWKPVTNATGYKLLIRKGKSGAYKTLAAISSGKTVAYTAKKLKKDSVYYFKIQAVRKSGSSKAYGKLSDPKKVDLRAPVTPVLNKATGKSGSVVLHWKKASGAKKYEIYRKTGSSGSYKKIKTIQKASTVKMTDKKVSSGKTYYYKIRSVSGSRKSNFSEELRVQILANKTVEVIAEDKQDDFAKAVSKMVKKNPVKASSAIAAADKFYTRRLIVKAAASGMDFSKLKPTGVIKSSDNIYILQFASSKQAKTALSKISNMANVKWVEPDTYVGTDGWRDEEVTPSRSDNTTNWGVDAIGAGYLASACPKNKSMLVAVIDTGVSSHTFLNGRLVSDGYDFVDNDSNPADLHGHGTHVSGIITSCTPGLGVKILPVRVLNAEGTGSSVLIGLGIRYAVDHKAKVINMSLSGGHSNYIDEQVAYAVKKGVTVVVAAGNSYGNTQNFCPAHITDCIVVGAVNESKQKAAFSNVGKAVDVVAPGVNIISCLPGGRYESWSGTSMAAPHVAALAGMLKLIQPSYTPAQIENAIKNSCRDLGSTGRDDQYGYGIPNYTNYGMPTGVSLDRTSASLKVGGTITLKATVSPSSATDKTVTWSSNNNNVASVSGGKVTAKASGSATIYVKTVNGKSASCTITVSPSQSDWKWSDWSGWSTTPVSPSNNVEVATKKQYRYRDRSTTTSTSPLDGWTLDHTSTDWSDWGPWSGLSWDQPAASDYQEVMGETVWRYYAFVCPTCHVREPFSGGCDNGHPTDANCWTETWMPIPYSSSNPTVWPNGQNKSYTTSLGDGLIWNFSTGNLYDTAPGTQDASGPAATVISTQYRYRTRSQVTTYYYYKWGSWSSWSDTPVSSGTDREVGTQTLYRSRKKIYS